MFRLETVRQRVRIKSQSTAICWPFDLRVCQNVRLTSLLKRLYVCLFAVGKFSACPRKARKVTVPRPSRSSLLKTLWEKEKMLVTSIFSFSHNVFYPIKRTAPVEPETRCVCETRMPPPPPLFEKCDLDLTGNLDLSIKEKVLSQGIRT